MKIYNSFGIKPSNSFTSAGSDYYIPNLDTPEKIEKAFKAFEKSYKQTSEDIKTLNEQFNIVINELHPEIPTYQIPNMIHLFLALYDIFLEERKQYSQIQGVYLFVDEFLVYDKNNDKVGVKVRVNDTLFINSGIKIALDTVLQEHGNEEVDIFRALNIGVAGLYVNKSGMGNKGWDVRACLVDEDYSGFVHLSQAFTKETLEHSTQNIIYCGDKLTQMMLIPVFHTSYNETDENEYNKIMAESNRGDNGFGSQDVKH